MGLVLCTVVHSNAPRVAFNVSFVVGAVGHDLQWVIRGKDSCPVAEEDTSECQQNCKLEKVLGKDQSQVVSFKDKPEFAPKAVLNRNCPEKN